MDRNELITRIVEMEWPMFSGVNNQGGKAACQYDIATFRITRTSQYQTWSDQLLESYAADLEDAAKSGRNLMTEKYARMMEKTYPQEYARLAPHLPQVEPETDRKIAEIVAINMAWKEEVDRKYPNLGARGRNVSAEADSPDSRPSLETYLRAELRNLSPKTIDIYHADTLRRKSEGRNEAEENLLNQVRQNGFADLNSANSYFAGKPLSATQGC